MADHRIQEEKAVVFLFPFGFIADQLRISKISVRVCFIFDSFHNQTMWAVQNLVVDSRLLQVVNSVFTLFIIPNYSEFTWYASCTLNCSLVIVIAFIVNKFKCIGTLHEI